jgi:hypothetical protein
MTTTLGSRSWWESTIVSTFRDSPWYADDYVSSFWDCPKFLICSTTTVSKYLSPTHALCSDIFLNTKTWDFCLSSTGNGGFSVSFSTGLHVLMACHVSVSHSSISPYLKYNTVSWLSFQDLKSKIPSCLTLFCNSRNLYRAWARLHMPMNTWLILASPRSMIRVHLLNNLSTLFVVTVTDLFLRFAPSLTPHRCSRLSLA